MRPYRVQLENHANVRFFVNKSLPTLKTQNQTKQTNEFKQRKQLKQKHPKNHYSYPNAIDKIKDNIIQYIALDLILPYNKF